MILEKRKALAMTTPEGEVGKQLIENGPFIWKNIIPTLWMAAVAAIGGAVSFYHKVKTGRNRPFNMTELIGEMVTSAFVGVVTYWICKAFDVPEYLTVAGVAISGHMGARAIFLLENKAEKIANDFFGVDDKKDQ